MATELFANNVATTLAGGISSGATSMTVASSTGFPTPVASTSQFRVLIGTEILIETAVSGTTWTVTRGAESSTAAAHSSGAAVTHVVTAAAMVSLQTAASEAAANAALLTEYGQLDSDPKQLWKPAPARSANLWTVANFYQGATLGSNTTALNKTLLAPTAVGTASNQNLTSRIILPQLTNAVYKYRLTFTVTTTSFAAGNPIRIQIGARNSGHTTLAGTTDKDILIVEQTDPVMTSHKNTYEIDYNPTTSSGATPVYLDVSISIANNVTVGGGRVTIDAMNVVQIESLTPAIWAGWDRAIAANAHFIASQPVGTRPDGVVMRGRRDFAPDGALELGLNELKVYPETAFQTPTKTTTSLFGNNGPQGQLHTNNNGQVLTVFKADNVTEELRGNVHGGEVGASGVFTTDYTAYADYQDGTGWVQITDYPWHHRCYRVKLVCNTKMTRTDQGSPFMLVTATYYLYADGTMRTDRTNTFQQNQMMAHWFYHMTSINPASNSGTRFLGRLGSGRKLVTPVVDFTDKLPAPVGATHTTSGAGGTIPASPSDGGWSVRVTALSPYGESTPSEDNTRIVTAGATSTVTANWSASVSPQGVAATKGYAVYFGVVGFEKFVGTVAAGVTTLLISAPPVGNAASPPTTNTAFTGSYTVGSVSQHPMADWSAIYDPNTKAVYSLAVDRDAIIAHTGIAGIRGTIAMFPGSIAKNYWELDMAGGDGGGFPYTVPSGTVYTDTLWSFTYMPRDLDRFEDEQTVRAANVKNLGSLYPAL